MFRSNTPLFRLQSLLAPKKRRTRGRLSHTVCEALEQRIVLDAHSVIEGKELIIEGTSYNDEVVVFWGTDGLLTVKSSSDELPGEAFQTFADAASTIDTIFFAGGDGNDQFVNLTMLKLTASGGDGNDILNAGNSRYALMSGGRDNDILIGNEWDSWLMGNEENDTLMGLGGRDLLFGGAGEDKLLGYGGTDLLFGGTGVDKLDGGLGVDYVDGGYDYGTDYIAAGADHVRDVFIDGPDGATIIDGLEKSIDEVYEVGYDAYYEFLMTGELPVSLGVNSSGYGIGEGTSFEFTAQDFGLSAVEIDWQNQTSEVDAYFANWMSDSLDEIAETENAFAPEEVEPMVEVDPDLLLASVNAFWEIESPVDGYFVEEMPVNYEAVTAIEEALIVDDPLPGLDEIVEDVSEALIIDVSVTDVDFDVFYEMPAIPPVVPMTTWNSFSSFQPSVTPSKNRFRYFG